MSEPNAPYFATEPECRLCGANQREYIKHLVYSPHYPDLTCPECVSTLATLVLLYNEKACPKCGVTLRDDVPGCEWCKTWRELKRGRDWHL